ncbi:MAG TPA: hypothetical protein VH302_09035, partial [Bryobacteraceae bacterium]|nr:hypothetical protein [Bryobacteraceae bacterium]
EDDIHGLADLHMQVDAVAGALSYMYGEAPNEELRARISELHGKVDEGTRQFNTFLSTDVGTYNKAAFAAGAPTVFAAPVKPRE